MNSMFVLTVFVLFAVQGVLSMPQSTDVVARSDDAGLRHAGGDHHHGDKHKAFWDKLTPEQKAEMKAKHSAMKKAVESCDAIVGKIRSDNANDACFQPVFQVYDSILASGKTITLDNFYASMKQLSGAFCNAQCTQKLKDAMKSALSQGCHSLYAPSGISAVDDRVNSVMDTVNSFGGALCAAGSNGICANDLFTLAASNNVYEKAPRVLSSKHKNVFKYFKFFHHFHGSQLVAAGQASCTTCTKSFLDVFGSYIKNKMSPPAETDQFMAKKVDKVKAAYNQFASVCGSATL